MNDIEIYTKQTSFEKLTLYLKYLVEYLNSFCFLSGAFVIQDNREKLFKLLNSVDNIDIDSTLTHKTYYQPNVSKLVEIILPEKNQIVIDCGIIPTTCLPEQVIKIFRLIKWYQFKNNENKFIYLKLEGGGGGGSFSPRHIMNAARFYAIGKNDPACIPTRRENCGAKCVFKQYNTAKIPYKFFNYTTIRYADTTEKTSLSKTYSNVETYQRKGDEVFIIEPVSEFIINIINDANKLFQVVKISPTFDTITIGYRIMAGNDIDYLDYLAAGGTNKKKSKRHKKKSKRHKKKSKKKKC
jgi:hypothetical protein